MAGSPSSSLDDGTSENSTSSGRSSAYSSAVGTVLGAGDPDDGDGDKLGHQMRVVGFQKPFSKMFVW